MIAEKKVALPRIYIAQTDRFHLRLPAMEDVEIEKVRCLDARCRFEWRYKKPERCWPVLLTQLEQWKTMQIGTLAIECKQTSQYMGVIHLHPFQSDGSTLWELGWGLVKEAEGKGIAMEAAQTARSWFFTKVAPTTRLYTRCKADNTRSQNLIKRLGGTYVKIIKDDVFGDMDLWTYPTDANG